MKKIIFSIVLIALSCLTFAQENELWFKEANEAYNQGNYQKAITSYKKIESSGNVSENLYFNIANSYYKLENVAESIYYYEKALSLSPNDEEIMNNYQFAQQMRIDQIESLPKGFLTSSYEYLVQLWSVDTWAWISVLFAFVFVIGFCLFYRASYTQQRRLFFGTWVLGLLISLFSLLFAFQTENYLHKTKFAIVFSEEINIQSEPNLRSEVLFKLHEGTKVQVLDVIEDWKEIKLSDGKTGWIPRKVIREI